MDAKNELPAAVGNYSWKFVFITCFWDRLLQLEQVGLAVDSAPRNGFKSQLLFEFDLKVMKDSWGKRKRLTGRIPLNNHLLESNIVIVYLFFLKMQTNIPKRNSVWFLDGKHKSLPCHCGLRVWRCGLRRSLFLGSWSNLASIFHSCAHFIDWPVGWFGEIGGKSDNMTCFYKFALFNI